MTAFKLKNREISLEGKPLIMGILNVTPDSFSDGGKYFASETAVRHAVEMLDSGADIIDIGGESTRPGADELSDEEEASRIIPVIKGLREQRPNCIISTDTRKSKVAEMAVNAGADIINDVSGLEFSADMTKVAAKTGAGLVLMHMRGTPADMQSEANLHYDDLIGDVISFLANASEKAIAAGVAKESIILDPGIGFSKDAEQNLKIIANIDKFKTLGYSLLVGPSRKSFIGTVLEENDPLERKWGTAGVVSYLALNGTEIIRVHDVKEMKQVLTMFTACLKRKIGS